MASMRIELFNNLLITCAQQPVLTVNTSRLQSLLAYLLLHSDSAQPREQLASLLVAGIQRIPGAHQSSATAASPAPRAACRMLPAGSGQPQRTVAARPRLHDRRRGIRCRPGARGGRRQTRRRRAERAALEEAARLYQDDLLRGLYDDWLQPKREHYRRQLAHVLQPPGDPARSRPRLSRGHPPRRTAGGAGSACRGAPPGADSPACRQSRPRQRAARLSPVQTRAAPRTRRRSRTRPRASCSTRCCAPNRSAAARAELPPASAESHFSHGGQAKGMGAAGGVLARCRARRHAAGADPGRAGHREIPAGGGIVRMVLAPGRRRGACALLFRVWPPRLRSHCRLAAIGAVERRMFAVGPGATRRTGSRAAGDPGGAPGDPTAASPDRELGAPPLL